MPAQASEQDALDFLVDLLRSNYSLQRYGYSVFVPTAIEQYLFKVGKLSPTQSLLPRWISELSPMFLSAAWSLCRLGVLRPSVERTDGQPIDGNLGYSLTTFGSQWLRESDDPLLIPSDSSRTTSMLLAVGAHFGDAYRFRAQEASACYIAHAYLACCAMVGGAAEAILLSAASSKLGEDESLAIYLTGNGRARLQSRLLGGSAEWMRREFESHIGLISYWRDQAAHGHSSAISESEAFTALRGLLRFAHFANDNWKELATKTAA